MHKNKKFNTLSGFGLIELMVSISIVVLVTSIILARHDSYNGAVLLRSQAYDIALKIREVQMQAVSAIGQGAEFRTRLGVCFNTSWDNYYLVFADIDNDGVCDIEDGEQVGQRGNIDPRFQIRSLNLDGSTETELAIIFERPNFDARFFVGTGKNNEQTNVEAVEIGLERVGAGDATGAGDLRVMEISRTGQILVKPVIKTTTEPDPCTGKNCGDQDPSCIPGKTCVEPDPPCEKDCVVDEGGGAKGESGIIDVPIDNPDGSKI